MSVWDKMPAHSLAINRNAANAIKGGCGHDVSLKEAAHYVEWDVPQPLRRPPQDQEDLTGRTFGRFRVIGYLAKPLGRAKWLVRCACSTFAGRSRKAIVNPANSQDCCRRCRQLEYLKKQGRS